MMSQFITDSYNLTAIATSQILCFKVKRFPENSSYIEAGKAWYLEVELINGQGSYILNCYKTENQAKSGLINHPPL